MEKNITINQLKDLNNKKVIIFGAGSTGHQIYTLLLKKGVNARVFAYCDTYKTGVDESTGLAILSVDSLMYHMDAFIIIGISDYLKLNNVLEVEARLCCIGFPAMQIVRHSQFIKLFSDLKAEEFDWQNFSDDVYDFDTNLLLIKHMAQCIDESDRSIVDLGAGNMNLKRFLPSSMDYYPVDYKPRNPETIICDLNKDEFPNIYADVYFLCAMLYYIEDPQNLLRKTAHYANKKILVSLHSANLISYKEIMHIHGFKNYVYVDDIRECLFHSGFLLSKEVVLEDVARRYVLFEKHNS